MSLKNVELQNVDYLYKQQVNSNGDGNDSCQEKDGDASSVNKKIVFEENNNEIEELANDFSKMGNITTRCNASASRKLSNDSGDYNHESIVDNEENAVSHYEEPQREAKNIKKQNTLSGNASLDYDYDDDFEEDFETKDSKIHSVPEPKVIDVVRKPDKVDQNMAEASGTRVKSENSVILDDNDFEQNNRPAERDYSVRSTSRCSLSFTSGSTMTKQRKINMSFSNERSMQIERENGILLRKILRSRDSGKSAPSQPPSRASSAFSARKRAQDKINHDNLILLRKIQKAKPTNVSMRR